MKNCTVKSQTMRLVVEQLWIEIESEQLTEVFTRIGERGVRAEIIAEEAADDALSYLKINAPVGPHLPD